MNSLCPITSNHSIHCYVEWIIKTWKLLPKIKTETKLKILKDLKLKNGEIQKTDYAFL